MSDIKQMAKEEFQSGLNCAESVLVAMTKAWGMECAAAPRIATAFGGGFAGTQQACGALTGALMAIGLKYGRDDAKGDRQPSYQATKQFIAWFQQRTDKGACRDITGLDFSDPEVYAAFRAPGGKHDAICVPLVEDVVGYLVENL